MFKLYFFLFISLINHTHLFHLSAHFNLQCNHREIYNYNYDSQWKENVFNNFETIFGCFFYRFLIYMLKRQYFSRIKIVFFLLVDLIFFFFKYVYPYWLVNKLIHFLTEGDTFAGFSVYVSTRPYLKSGTLCYQHDIKQPLNNTVSIDCFTSGRYVTVYSSRQNTNGSSLSEFANINICEINITGNTIFLL